MPELPEVESLVRGLAERAGGLTVTRCELVSISALKTFDPPLRSLEGRKLVACTRRGKFLCLDLEERFLVFHLARSGFLRWREELKPAPARQGRGPLALRVRGAETDEGAESLGAEYFAHRIANLKHSANSCAHQSRQE